MKISQLCDQGTALIGIPVKEEGYNIHLWSVGKGIEGITKSSAQSAEVIGSLVSQQALSFSQLACFPHMEPVIGWKWLRVLMLKRRSVEKFEHSLKRRECVKWEGVVSNGKGQEAISEHIFRGECQNMSFMNDFQPAWNEEDEIICRLKSLRDGSWWYSVQEDN